MSKQPLINIADVSKTFNNGLRVLKNINLQVFEGDVIGIIGPSGSGKSTLLRCINQLEPISDGEIYLDDELLGYKKIMKNGQQRYQELDEKIIAKQRQKVGMVFQKFNLFPNLTALDNIIAPQIIVNKTDKSVAKNKALELLELVGLSEHANHFPSQLSGGQQQRVAIARCLSMDPEIILLDEPTSALDPELVEEVQIVIEDLVKRDGVTMVIVSHDMQFIQSIATEVIMMDKGKLIEQAPPNQLFKTPQKKRTKKFLKTIM